MAFLTLFRVATGDNWNGIMKDALREDCDNAADCVKNCCVADGIAPMFFVIFVLMAQFVLVNVVVAVLMKHLEESHKQVWKCMPLNAVFFTYSRPFTIRTISLPVSLRAARLHLQPFFVRIIFLNRFPLDPPTVV